MIRLVENFDNLREGEWVEPVGDWPIMNQDGTAYSGLAVELYGTGEIWSVAEVVNGCREGYTVEYFKNGLVSEVNECHRNVDTGLVAMWNENGELEEAYRFEHEVRTAALDVDRQSVERHQVEEDVADQLEIVRKYVPKPLPEIPNSIEYLLERFDGKGESLYREAQLGLGLE